MSPRLVFNTNIAFLFQLFVWPVRCREIWFSVHRIGYKKKRLCPSRAIELAAGWNDLKSGIRWPGATLSQAIERSLAIRIHRRVLSHLDQERIPVFHSLLHQRTAIRCPWNQLNIARFHCRKSRARNVLRA
jgi:hypothetical protein